MRSLTFRALAERGISADLISPPPHGGGAGTPSERPRPAAAAVGRPCPTPGGTAESSATEATGESGTSPGTTARAAPGSTCSIPLGTMPPAAALAGLPSIGATSAPDGSGGETTIMVLSDLLTAGGPGRMVPAAGAYVGDGMPPVPAKLAAKVRRWEFVEMGELLPEFWVGQPRELEREASRGRTRQARQVTDIFTWVQCFGTYVAVVAPVEPLAVPELMAYMGTIVRVSQDYDGLGWVRYDSAFRHQAARSGNKKWSVINGTLFTMNFSGTSAGTRRCELCFATSHSERHSERDCAQSGNLDPGLGERLKSLESAVIAMAKPARPVPVPVSPQVFRPSGEACRKWNLSGCTFPECRHLHICSSCGGNHPAARCWGPGPAPREVMGVSVYSDEINQKLPSRWDTPSPGADITKRGRKSTPQPYSSSKGQNHRDDESGEDDWGGHGRGRGRKRKRFKNFKRKGKRFFIDNKPSMDLGVDMEPTEDDKAKIYQRINRFGKQGAQEGNKKKKISIDDMLKTVVSSNADDQIYWQDSSVEGTSQSLEKAYLRLTSAPDPSMVRPVRVLRMSLRHVCDKWKANRDYHYTREQFKSIRQDLTIQGVRDKLAIEVYETHARIALENNDREEFNQCQTQLMALYKEKNLGDLQNQAEFTAYRMLYHILTNSTADIFAILKELTFELKKVPCVKHAIGVCSAWLSGNYCQFFRLYRTAPLMCGALINMFIERERKVALRSIIKAYVEIYSEWECRKCAAYTVFTLAFSIPFRSVPF